MQNHWYGPQRCSAVELMSVLNDMLMTCYNNVFILLSHKMFGGARIYNDLL